MRFFLIIRIITALCCFDIPNVDSQAGDLSVASFKPAASGLAVYDATFIIG